MEIIKEGNVEKKTTSCPNCSAELSYMPGDVHYEHKTYELESVSRWWIVCPCCGYEYDPEYSIHHPYKESKVFNKVFNFIEKVINKIKIIS